MRIAALLLAAALPVASADCSIRFLNELPTVYGTSSLSFTTASDKKSSAIDVLSPHTAGNYVSVPCEYLQLEVTVSGGTSKLPTPLTAAVNLTQGGDGSTNNPVNPPVWTVYSYLLLNEIPAIGTVSDASELIPTKIGNIDLCGLRVLVLDPTTTGATVFGVINQCSENCTKSQLFYGLSGAAPIGYNAAFDCSAHWLLQLVADNGKHYNQNGDDWSVKPWEHGYYTILVRNASLAAQGIETYTLLADVQGPNPYLPLFLAPVALAVLWVIHWLVGRLVVLCCANAGNEAATKKGEEGEVTCLKFWGYDKVLQKAAAEAKTSSSSASSAGFLSTAASTGASGFSMPLLPSDPEPFGAAVAKGDSAAVGAAAPAVSTKPKSAGRIRAIDALRGLALVFMIFVNYGAGSYSFLDHAKWNGLNLADLLFPTFVWTQGVSMAIATDAARRRGASKWELAKKVIIRAIKLYALGCFLNDGIDLSNWRLLGVLQYFAVSSLFVGLMEIFILPSGSSSQEDESGGYMSVNGGASRSSSNSNSGESFDSLTNSSILRNLWRDIGRYWLQWILIGAIFTLYLLVQFKLPLDNGCPTGYIGAGGLADGSAYLGKGCTGGAHRKIDMAIFSPWHVYHNSDPITGEPITAATCGDAFQCDVYDPEGVLGWISACVMTFLGLQAGRVFVNYRPLLTEGMKEGGALKRMAALAYTSRWLTWSAVIGLTGAALAGFTRGNTGVIPINKNLWSPSFIFCVAGVDFLLLAVFFLVIDVAKGKWRVWSGAPLAYVGMNSIVVYASHEIFQEYFPLTFHAGPDFSSHAEYLTSNIIGVLCWIAVARILYIKKIFVNL